MPPVTPSPHRFLAGQKRQPSPPKESKRLPALRRAEPADRESTPRRAPQAPTASQFAATPRFAFGRAPQARPASPPKPTLTDALRTSSRPVEDVDETLEQDDEDDEMLMPDDEEVYALPTTERSFEDVQQWANDLPYSPKRRKLDNFEPEPTKPTFQHPTTPASHLPPKLHTFPRAGSIVSTTAAADIRRPQFLRSSIAPSEPPAPLPEAFSPHRRGEKFVPRGMASTLQQWVIETGEAAQHSRKGLGYLKGEDYVLRMRVGEVGGSGSAVLVRGSDVDAGREGDVRVMLVDRSGGGDVAVGRVVGVRVPLWEVEMEGYRWTVGVDWKVLLPQ